LGTFTQQQCTKNRKVFPSSFSHTDNNAVNTMPVQSSQGCKKKKKMAKTVL